MMERIPQRISRRFIRVWQRNLTVYQKTWKISFLPPLLEPLFYLLAFGVGLGVLVGKVVYHSSEVSYVAFIAPALIAINIMYNAFFENTYASFVRMYYQKSFDAIMATPLSLEEIITGEIIWGATKSVIATLIMLGVISLFGLISYPQGLLTIPLAFLGGILPLDPLACFSQGLCQPLRYLICLYSYSLPPCSSSAGHFSLLKIYHFGRKNFPYSFPLPTLSISPDPSVLGL